MTLEELKKKFNREFPKGFVTLQETNCWIDKAYKAGRQALLTELEGMPKQEISICSIHREAVPYCAICGHTFGYNECREEFLKLINSKKNNTKKNEG
jgi:hypothetical protein